MTSQQPRLRRLASTAVACLALPMLFGSTCDVAAYLSMNSPPNAPEFHSFYAKRVDALGIPILGSAFVSDTALYSTRDLLLQMTSGRFELLSKLSERGVRVAVIGEDEVTTDIPEYSDLDDIFPDIDWDARTRGLGATWGRPVCSVGEENILGCAREVFRGESALIHEFAHTVLEMAVEPDDPDFVARLDDAYAEALAAGLWSDTYAASDINEYWAEGVQDWFDANRDADPPNGVHNHVNTREELWDYDPRLAALIREVFGDQPWRYSYPSTPDPTCGW